MEAEARVRAQDLAHLDEVAQHLVGLHIGLLDLLELGAEPHAVCLEVQVGVLAPWDLILIYIGVARFHGGSAVEGCVQPPGPLPVLTVVKHALQGHPCKDARGRGLGNVLSCQVLLPGPWGQLWPHPGCR